MKYGELDLRILKVHALRAIAERDKDESKASRAMEILRKADPSYHWCDDWDGMVICDKDEEFKCCTCKPK